jgi:hypothetical protein
LFGVLPAYVAALSGAGTRYDHLEPLADLLPMIAALSKEDIMSNTAMLFERGFAIIDAHPTLLELSQTWLH